MNFKELKTCNAIRATASLLADITSNNPFARNIDPAIQTFFMVPQNSRASYAVHSSFETLREKCPRALSTAIRNLFKIANQGPIVRYFDILSVMITIERELEAGKSKEDVIVRNALLLQGIVGEYYDLYRTKEIPGDSKQKQKLGLYGDPYLDIDEGTAKAIYESIDMLIEEIEADKK